MIKPVYKYKVKDFLLSNSLNKLKELNVKIYKLNKVSENEYTFYASIYALKRIQSVFLDVNIIKQTGYLSIFLSLFKYKTTIICLIISMFFYLSISNRIWIINIKGDTNNLLTFINDELKNNNIYIGAKKISTDELSKIQNKILYKNFNTIEYLSISMEGSKIDVSFKKKRDETIIEGLKGNLYAAKDGLIKSFDLISGEKVVQINDYVKKGDLLVQDVLINDYNEQIYIGTKGKVYAYTWYYITINSPITSNLEESEVFANLLFDAKNQISLNFTDNEYIYSENVLQFNMDSDSVYMKMHFTCVEDIAKE